MGNELIGGAGDDTIDGGGGIDTAVYRYTANGVSVDLAAGLATGEGTDHLANIENIIGSASADTLKGDAGDNRLNGAEGDDMLEGGAGNDVLIGCSGRDTFVFAPGSGVDVIRDFHHGDVIDLRAYHFEFAIGAEFNDMFELSDNGVVIRCWNAWRDTDPHSAHGSVLVVGASLMNDSNPDGNLNPYTDVLF